MTIYLEDVHLKSILTAKMDKLKKIKKMQKLSCFNSILIKLSLKTLNMLAINNMVSFVIVAV